MFGCCGWFCATSGFLSTNGCLLFSSCCLCCAWLKICALESRQDEMIILLRKNRHQINSIDINAYK